jgi:hypothetical protein
MGKKINEAVQNAIDNLAWNQQNLTAFDHIITRIRSSDNLKFRRDGLPDEAVIAIYNELHRRVNEAWSNLAWFALDERVKELLAARTRTFFERDDSAVMGFLGNYGAYYTEDEEKFKAEVKQMFEKVSL